MKKSKIISVIVLAFLIIGTGIYLFTKKETVEKTTVTSDGNSYMDNKISVVGELHYYSNDHSDDNKCNNWFSDKTIWGNAYNEKEVEEGYPLYIDITGCSNSLSGYINKFSQCLNSGCSDYKEISMADTKQKIWNACDIQYTYFESTKIIFPDEANEFNNSCGSNDIYGKTVTSTYTSENCNILKQTIKKDYVSAYNSGLIKNYNNYCKDKSGIISLSSSEKEYKKGTSNQAECEKTKIVSDSIDSDGNLIPFTGIKNGVCEYPLYYKNGNASTIEDVISDDTVDSNIKVSICRSYKEYIQNKNVQYLNEEYNNLCVGEGKPLDESESLSTIVKVVFTASGINTNLNCPTGTNFTSTGTGTTECTYSFSSDYIESQKNVITLNQSQLPSSSNGGVIIHNTSKSKLKGWRSSASTYCYEGDVTIEIDSGIKTINLVPCYEAGNASELDYTIYKKCGVLKSDNTMDDTIAKKVTETDHSGNLNETVNNAPILTSEINSTQLYVYDSWESDKEQDYSNKIISSLVKYTNTKSGNTFKLNQFCNVSCSESVSYKYPSIFQTVKSGTYFQLLSYPEVTSTLTCHVNYGEGEYPNDGYTRWINAYKKQIRKEKSAYVDEFNYDEIMNGAEITKSGCCNSNEYGCYNDEYKATFDLYSFNDDGNLGSVDKMSSISKYYCEDDGIKSVKDSLVKSYVSNSNSSNLKQVYDNQVKKRLLLEQDNFVCGYTLSEKNMSFTDSEGTVYNNLITGKNTTSFYNPNPKVIFNYQSTKSSDYKSDSLKQYKTEETDTKLYNNITENYNSSTGEIESTYSFNGKEIDTAIEIKYGEGKYSSGITFKPIHLENAPVRQVTKKFIFNNSEDHTPYYTEKQTGNVTTYASKDNEPNIYLGYVYPVDRTTTGIKKVNFEIDFNSNLGYGADVVLNSNNGHGTSLIRKNNAGSYSWNSNENSNYECYYNVAEDIIKEDENQEDKYKRNFYVRSISTSNVDPNNRKSSGKLGANWAGEKGTKLIEIIESKAKNSNTYNPENLEYAFTLNAQTIELIRQYNNSANGTDITNPYSDFNLKCNDVGGECVSKFLSDLENGKVNGVSVSGVNATVKPVWKYYIDGKWQLLSPTKTLNSLVVPECAKYKSSDYLKVKDYYECIYKEVNEGVLP